jgi:hypothetical protein
VEDPCEHGNRPSGSITCWEILRYATDGFSRRAQLHGVKLVNLKEGKYLKHLEADRMIILK